MKTYKVIARAAVYRHPNSSLKPKTLIQSNKLLISFPVCKKVRRFEANYLQTFFVT